MPLPNRVLIIEDEFLIATDLEFLLTRTGISQIRLAGESQEALDLIQAESWDAAILDANLRGRSSEPIAIKLSDRGIPFVVVTGYDFEKLPLTLREARVLQKPIREAALIESLTLNVAISEPAKPKAANGIGTSLERAHVHELPDGRPLGKWTLEPLDRPWSGRDG